MENLSIDYGTEYNDTDSNEVLYEKLEEKGHTFSKDFDVNQALGIIDNSYSILPPSTITVIEYAQGDLKW